MFKIQEALDLIIGHYIDELREVRLGGRHAIPDRYALTILEDTEAIRNYVKPALADRIRELDEQVPKTRIEDLIREIEGEEGKTSTVWHTGTPIEEGWYLLVCLIGNSDNTYYGVDYWSNDMKYWSVNRVVAWQRIEPYKEAGE